MLCFFLISALNAPSDSYLNRVNDTMWIVVVICLVVCALLLKRRKAGGKEVAPCVTIMIEMGLMLSVIAVSWALLRLLASSEVVLNIGLGGQKLRYIMEQVLRAAPNSITGRAFVTVGVGIIMWIGFGKKPFGSFPRYFSGIALTIFLLCCVVLMFMVMRYY